MKVLRKSGLLQNTAKLLNTMLITTLLKMHLLNE